VKISRTILLAAVAFAALAAGVVSVGFAGCADCADGRQAQNMGMRIVSGAVLTEIPNLWWALPSS
jgi:hypothetical protein